MPAYDAFNLTVVGLVCFVIVCGRASLRKYGRPHRESKMRLLQNNYISANNHGIPEVGRKICVQKSPVEVKKNY